MKFLRSSLFVVSLMTCMTAQLGYAMDREQGVAEHNGPDAAFESLGHQELYQHQDKGDYSGQVQQEKVLEEPHSTIEKETDSHGSEVKLSD